MGYNTSHYDANAALDAKSTKELEELKVFWTDVLSRRSEPQDRIAREQLALIGVKLAERIGKQKK